MGLAALVTCIAVVVCTLAAQAGADTEVRRAPARFLYIWMGDKDEHDSDFMAVVDVRENSPTYARVISTQPVGLTASMPHHLEYELPAAGELLFANAHHHETILLFDFADATRPKVVDMVRPVAPFRFPHDFARLPNRHVLVGFMRSEGPSPTPGDDDMPGGHGGLAELDGHGRLVRSRSAADPSLDRPVRPYAILPMPRIDRVVTTSALMMEKNSADVVQVWRLSDLALLHTIRTPPAQLPNGQLLMTRRSDGAMEATGHMLPFEPREMSDGSVLLNAYGCGFYRLTELTAPQPRIENVFTIEIPAEEHLGGCGVPVVVGRYWIMPVGAAHMVVSLNVSDPSHPVEVSRLPAEGGFFPHWLAKDPGSNRLILGQDVGNENRMLMLRVDTGTGRLWWDQSFRSEDGSLGLSFRRQSWPHGNTGEATGHAALFRP